MFRLGIGGGIGSGKTLVCSVLEVLGIPVYYADSEARRLMDEKEDLKEEISGLLGSSAYSNGQLDRKYVAGRVFGHEELLQDLNRIVHPAVREDFLQWAARQRGVPYVAEEAAILFESGAYRYMDATAFVTAPMDLRVRRVIERDGIEPQDVLDRISRQADPEELKARADYVIINDGQRMLLPQVVAMHEKIINR